MKTVTHKFKLAPDERRLLMLYRATTGSAQGDLLTLEEEYARLFPRHAAPALRLVSGGAQ